MLRFQGGPPPLPVAGKLGGLILVGRLAVAEVVEAKAKLETAKAEPELLFAVLMPERMPAII